MLHQNNLHFLRFLLAILVVLGHAYALTDPLGTQQYNGQLFFSSLTALAVNAFFVISGYLIYNSLMHTKSYKQYVANRLLRIIPLFYIVIIATVALCSFFYNGVSVDYWTQKSTWSYLFNNLSILHLSHEIDGVFTNNPEPHINGSLWSIPYELICYFLFSPLYLARKRLSEQQLHVVVVVLYSFLVALFLAVHFFEILHWSNRLETLLKCAMLFSTGMLLARFGAIAQWKRMSILFAGMLFVVLYYGRYWMDMGNAYTLAIFPFAFFILYLGFWPNSLLPRFAVWGDASYGIYLMTFPLQQMLLAMFPNWHPMANFGVTFAVVIPLAYASWHWIEQPILAWKNKI